MLLNRSNVTFLTIYNHMVIFFFRQGDIESSLKYLEMFVELADRSEQLPDQQRACSSLGAIYNSLVSTTIQAEYS